MRASQRRVLTDGERLDCLRLIRCEGIGPISFKGLVDSHGSAGAVIEALPDIIRRSGRSLRLPSEASLQRELAAMEKLGARFIAIGEPEYPEALASIDSAPPLIAVRGSLAVLSKPMVAIIGARNASAVGQSVAAEMAANLANAGYAVVSGLARGIDKAAHEATLRSGTVAVVAGGLGKIYPPEHESLVQDLIGTGCVITEAPFDWVATARDFPKRNRIVSGLALGVVIIEAAMKSGSLITARLALEQGRELMAVPGSPRDPRHDGCNKLIRECATLVRHAGDVLEVIAPLVEQRSLPVPSSRQAQPRFDFDALDGPPAPRTQPILSGDADQDRLVGLLGPSPVAMDDLVRASGLEPRRVQLILLDLDLAGRIERHGNGMVSLL
ncbi:DNA-processing protein DprA [Labrys okinawensis]|uniref:DNA-processing protein DprA n=1 Tax=Labrys okinawensis TaxID=346911 RepID=UPI0039BCE864